MRTPGDARGCEATPLVVSGLVTADGGVRNVVFLATMAKVPTYDGRVDVYGLA